METDATVRELKREINGLKRDNIALKRRMRSLQETHMFTAVWEKTDSKTPKMAFRCSNCARKAGYHVVNRYRHCPGCGARMINLPIS